MHRKATSYLKALVKPFDLSICYLCKSLSRSGELCGFCCRALTRALPIPADQRKALQLDAISVAYQDVFPLDHVIRAWKDQGRRGLLEPLASLWPTIHCPADCRVLAMPGSDRGIRRRGEDPLSQLARVYAHRLHRPVIRAYRLDSDEARPKARRTMNASCLAQFSLPPGLQNVLIVDDVLGKDGSLQALARALRAQGVSWLGAAILAHRRSERSGLIHSDP